MNIGIPLSSLTLQTLCSWIYCPLSYIYISLSWPVSPLLLLNSQFWLNKKFDQFSFGDRGGIYCSLPTRRGAPWGEDLRPHWRLCSLIFPAAPLGGPLPLKTAKSFIRPSDFSCAFSPAFSWVPFSSVLAGEVTLERSSLSGWAGREGTSFGGFWQTSA